MVVRTTLRERCGSLNINLDVDLGGNDVSTPCTAYAVKHTYLELDLLAILTCLFPSRWHIIN